MSGRPCWATQPKGGSETMAKESRELLSGCIDSRGTPFCVFWDPLMDLSTLFSWLRMVFRPVKTITSSLEDE